MRARWFFIGLLVLILAACRPSVRGVKPTERPCCDLVAIDSLMWSKPDSALTLLLAFAESPEADSLDEFNGHYCQMLVSELLYTNDYEQTNREDLLKAVAYFDTIDQAFLAARAHYINGVGYYERDSVVEACEEYLKALEVMEEYNGEKELVGHKARFMALTYTHLCELFSDQYLHEQAIITGKCSLPYYRKCETEPWSVAWVLVKTGSQYDMMEQWDSAGYYYVKAMEALPDSNSLTFRDVTGLQALLSYKTEKNADDAIGKLVELSKLSESERERLARYAVIGEIYYNERRFDLARWYLETVFQQSTSTASRKQCAEYLAEICKAQGDSLKFMECVTFLAPFANENENNSTLRSQLTLLFDTHWDNRSDRSRQKNITKRTFLTLFAFGCLLAIIVLVLIIHKRSIYAFRLQQSALAGRLKQSNEAWLRGLETIRRQEMELKSKNKDDATNYSAKERYDLYLQAEICQEIRTLADRLNSNKQQPLKTNIDISEYKPYALTKLQQNKLLKTFDSSFPGLLESLKTVYHGFDRKGELYCALHMLEIDRMTMCVLLQEPYHTCRRISLRLEKGFGCPNHLYDFLIETIQGF